MSPSSSDEATSSSSPGSGRAACGEWNSGGDRCEARAAEPEDVSAHDHDHDHGHSHAHARSSDKKKLAITLSLSAVILVAELVGGFMSGSLALISDAGHVFTDMSAQLLSLLALLMAGRPATARRTFGYYRLEILAALVNGVLLVVLAGGVGWGAYQRLRAGVGPIETDIMLPVAIVGLVANLAGAWLLHGAQTLNVRGAYLHVVSDALASVAVVGGGVAIAISPSLRWLDPILGLLIAVLVVVSALRLLAEATDVLLETVPKDLDLDRVRRDVASVQGIESVHDLHIWTITSGLRALSAHVIVADPTHNDDVLRRVKELLVRQHRIAHSTLQIESTAYDGPLH